MECILLEEVKIETKAKVATLDLVGERWTLHVDGATNIGGSRAGMILPAQMASLLSKL